MNEQCAGSPGNRVNDPIPAGVSQASHCPFRETVAHGMRRAAYRKSNQADTDPYRVRTEFHKEKGKTPRAIAFDAKAASQSSSFPRRRESSGRKTRCSLPGYPPSQV